MKITNENNSFVLIGAGIMSATLGVLIKKLIPNAQIDIYERLDKVGTESSAAWNNAGTGHSSFCELNYTPELDDGSIDLTKALRIAEQFEVSKQFWSYLVKQGNLSPKRPFINDIDHMSFVWGKENVAFLRKRYEAMVKYPIFEDMIYSDDEAEVKSWIPLIMNGRKHDEPFAATRMEVGTDVNFGMITKGMIKYLDNLDGVELHLAHHINDIKRLDSGKWSIKMENLTTDKKVNVESDFVFIGAGGGSLPLLEKSDIPEGKGYGGFPVSGQWLRCNNKDVIAQHEAKVYGKASVGSPPMSTPHLDTRIINGRKCLLFGPYAGFSTKFLKNGDYTDLFFSVETHNVWPMLKAGWNNIPLTKYLIDQVLQSKEDRFETLQQYYPEAKIEDWETEIAGQRVQIIKKDQEEGGVLKFGTEVVTSSDGSLSALLGASPGASTSVSIMLDVLSKCFKEHYSSIEWQDEIRKMIPSFGRSLIQDGDYCRKIRKVTTKILKLADGPEGLIE